MRQGGAVDVLGVGLLLIVTWAFLHLGLGFWQDKKKEPKPEPPTKEERVK